MKNPVPIAIALIAAAAASAKPPADIQAKLDDFTKGGPGGVAVAWVDADGAAFFQAGTMSADDPRPVTADTQFELGSVSKVFTSLLLAESERAGKVSRLDPAARYLLPPGDPAQGALAGITLLSLATHTSGLPRMPSNFTAGPADEDPYAGYGDAALVSALRSDGPGARAGTAVNYSNFGAAVLGAALARAWGVPYPEALTSHVLQPLGLRETSLGMAGLPPLGNLAPGHVAGRKVPNWTFEAFAPAGALRSSARDMAVFLGACLGRGDAPLRSSFEATLKPQFASADTGGHIGLGWLLADDSGDAIAWHNGATAGSHTLVAFSPGKGAGVAILCNIQKGSEGLGFALLGAEAPHPRVSSVENASDYVGHYPLAPEFVMSVTSENGSLAVQATGQPALGLREVARDRFSVAGVAAEVSFERDAHGKVVALILHQNGVDQRAPRGEPPPAPKEVALPAELLHGYAGRYPLAPSFVIEVTEEDGGLFAQATGQAKFQIYASARDEFYYKVVNARISFQRDGAGRISGLVLHQNGRDMQAARAGD